MTPHIPEAAAAAIVPYTRKEKVPREVYILPTMTDNHQQQQKPIYVATYGRDPKMAAAVSEKLLPDVEGL